MRSTNPLTVRTRCLATTARIRPLALAIVIGLVLPAAASAQDAAPTHQCQAPTIPAEITDQATADRIRAQVNTYKQCIQDFASAQQALAERHNKAANAAIAEFNQFVQTKLPSK